MLAPRLVPIPVGEAHSESLSVRNCKAGLCLKPIKANVSQFEDEFLFCLIPGNGVNLSTWQIMRNGIPAVLSGAALIAVPACAQSVLFDFDNALPHSPLPLSLTVGEITAQFSATGQGFSIQEANAMGFTPAGFSGYCLYPSSVFAADLLIGFSQALADFSILYAPQELACDSSARMKVTAYLNDSLIGSNTTNANAGTWPSETLALTSVQPFNRVIVHYDARPSTGGDWGPIFMADNMVVTPAPSPPILTDAVMLPNGAFSFTFSATAGGSFTVFATTNLSLPLSSWTGLGPVAETSTGLFQFTDPPTPGTSQRFYRVRSP
jgi:hypothetical protein